MVRDGQQAKITLFIFDLSGFGLDVHRDANRFPTSSRKVRAREVRWFLFKTIQVRIDAEYRPIQSRRKYVNC